MAKKSSKSGKKREEKYDDCLQNPDVLLPREGMSFQWMRFEVGMIVFPKITETFQKRGERLTERACKEMLHLISAEIRAASSAVMNKNMREARKILSKIDWNAAYEKYASEK